MTRTDDDIERYRARGSRTKQPKKPEPCPHCEDVADRYYMGLWYCLKCYMRIKRGHSVVLDPLFVSQVRK